MNYTYKTKDVCSTQIDFRLEGDRVHDVRFTGGCNGNLKAIGKLVEGKDAKEIAQLLRGNTCGFKNTSCADQLSRAIDQALGA